MTAPKRLVTWQRAGTRRMAALLSSGNETNEAPAAFGRKTHSLGNLAG
jgi:hypothetical protein